MKLDALERLEVWLRADPWRDVHIEHRNIPGYGQMVPGFQVKVTYSTPLSRDRVRRWERLGHGVTVEDAVSDALDKAGARKTRDIGRKRARA